MSHDQQKQAAARAALEYIQQDIILGVGTGSTVNYLIDLLPTIKEKIRGCLASSVATEKYLQDVGMPVFDPNLITDLPLYIDGADEVDNTCKLIKGGGGALTREKILASMASSFVCIVDSSKVVTKLGKFPLAIEVLPMARNCVARTLENLGFKAHYRNSYLTDNGNEILDLHGLKGHDLSKLEGLINNIPGVVENGLFTHRKADIVLVGTDQGIVSMVR